MLKKEDSKNYHTYYFAKAIYDALLSETDEELCDQTVVLRFKIILMSWKLVLLRNCVVAIFHFLSWGSFGKSVMFKITVKLNKYLSN